jgi:hypothetical protein
MIANPWSFRGNCVVDGALGMRINVCVAEDQRLIAHHEQVDSADHTLGRHVGGVEHPSIQGKFFAMS